MGREPSKAGWQHDALAALVLLAMAALLLWRHGDIGPTVDEPFHLVRGLSWWWTGTAKLSYAHPPLANVLMAAPAALMYPPIDLTAVPGWDVSDHSSIAHRITTEHYELVRPMLMAARRASVAVGITAAAAVYLWTSRRIEPWVGLVALGLLAFNPTFLAHAQLVTTDLPVAFTVFLSVATFIDYLKPRTTGAAHGGRAWLGLMAFALAVGFALITKFTALTFVPFFAVIGLYWAWRGWGRFTQATRGRRLWVVARDMLVVAVVAILVVDVMYRFEGTFLTVDAIRAAPEPQCYITEDWDGDFLENLSIVGLLPGWLVVPVPYTWLFGLEMVRTQGHMLHSTWFMGRASQWGNPAYFPTLFLLKTPVAVHVGLVLGGVRFVRARRWPDAVGGVLLGAALMLLALLMTSMLNIGFRHALPIVPLLTVLSAWAIVETARDVIAWGGGPRRQWIVGGVVALLVATSAAATVANAGRYLSYFNVGRGLGHRVSIVGEDWGQDTIRLARVVQERDLKPLRYNRYGAAAAAELRYQGVDELYLQGCSKRVTKLGWLAMHASNAERYGRRCFREARRPPDLVVGHIYLWQLTPEPVRDRVQEQRARRRAQQESAESR